MRTRLSILLGVWRMGAVSLLLGLAVHSSVSAQTNLTASGSVQTNAVSPYRLPAPSDFQRLQYYYAAHPNCPAPGTERGVFTLHADRKWSGDWNSKAVPKPTRAQLSAITPQQVDLFKRAATYTGGAWRIVTSKTNLVLSALTVSPSTHAEIRATADKDRRLAEAQRVLSDSLSGDETTP